MSSSNQHQSLAHRLRKTKAALLAVTLTLVGILLIALNTWITPLNLGTWSWIQSIPLGELGGILFGAGFLGTVFEYSLRKDQEEATVDRFRDTIREQAPTMRDAVIEGFAIKPDDLKRVATPELLDTLATNAMALRLGDDQFAAELYADIRDQAIRAPERWHDVEVDLRLSTAVERSTSGTPLLDLTVQWEYTTIPAHAVRRFACVSDRADYTELRHDIPATSTWFMQPRPGMNAGDRESYELLEFTVDGVSQPIRRTARKAAQIYSVQLDESVVAGEPVRIRHVFRARTPSWGHRLFFELPQPARDTSLTMDYTNTNIAEMRVIDTIATARPVQISRTPDSVPGKAITVDVPGWLLPKSGVAFTWTMETELPRERRAREAA